MELRNQTPEPHTSTDFLTFHFRSDLVPKFHFPKINSQPLNQKQPQLTFYKILNMNIYRRPNPKNRGAYSKHYTVWEYLMTYYPPTEIHLDWQHFLTFQDHTAVSYTTTEHLRLISFNPAITKKEFRTTMDKIPSHYWPKRPDPAKPWGPNNFEWEIPPAKQSHKLSYFQATEIRRLHEQGYEHLWLAFEFKVSRPTISRILNNKTHR